MWQQQVRPTAPLRARAHAFLNRHSHGCGAAEGSAEFVTLPPPHPPPLTTTAERSAESVVGALFRAHLAAGARYSKKEKKKF